MRPATVLRIADQLFCRAGPILGAALWLLVGGDSSAQSPRAVPVDGEPFEGRLAAVDSEWRITFAAEDAPHTIRSEDLVRWGEYPEPRRGPLVLLADGGVLPAAIFESNEKSLTLDGDVLGLVRVPHDAMVAIVYQPPSPGLSRDRLLDAVRNERSDTDCVRLTNGDRLAGRLEEIAEDHLRLATELAPIEVPIHRVVALGLATNDAEGPAGLWATVGLSDGTRLAVQRMVVDDSRAEFHCAGLPVCSAAAEAIVFVQIHGGRAVYLSDLEPADEVQVPFLDLAWPTGTDRNLFGGRLRSGGQVRLKGLGVHAASRLKFLLDEEYERFQADVGIDDDARGRGSAMARVFVDAQETYRSATLRGGEPAVGVSVDLDGAERLDLVVDFADRADEQDHVDWLDARLIRPSAPRNGK